MQQRSVGEHSSWSSTPRSNTLMHDVQEGRVLTNSAPVSMYSVA